MNFYKILRKCLKGYFILQFSFLIFHCGSISDLNPGDSAPVPTVSDGNAPAEPASLWAMTGGSSQINLIWSAATDDISTQNTLVYEICQSDFSGGCATFTTAQTVEAGVTTASITNLNPMETYYFQIRAIDQAGNISLPSAEATATTDAMGVANSPVFSPAAGKYSTTQNVAITSTTTGSTICYTADGSAPSCNTAGSCATGTLYSSPVNVTSSKTLNAIACESGYTASNISNSAYTIDMTGPSAPGYPVAMMAGTSQINLYWFASTDDVSVPSNLVYQICVSSNSGGCSIFNVSATTGAGSTNHSVSGLNPLTSYYFMVRAVDQAGNIGVVSAEASTTTDAIGTVNNPVFSPVAGVYRSTTVTITTSSPTGAAVCYTTDGSSPSCNTSGSCNSGTPYSTGLNLTTNQTIKAVGCATSYHDSGMSNADYIIDDIPPSTPGYFEALSSSNAKIDLSWISSTDNRSAQANLIYEICAGLSTGSCTDTSFPIAATTAAGATNLALSGLTPQTKYFFKIRSVDEVGNISNASAEVIATTSGADSLPPVTTSSQNGGMFTMAQTVTLTCSDIGSGCQNIVYTTDGTIPTATNGITIAGSTTSINIGFGSTKLSYTSQDIAGNWEPYKEIFFNISNTGFTYTATNAGVSMGAGPNPTSFSNNSYSFTGPWLKPIYHDSVTKTLYLATRNGLLISGDSGNTWTHRTLIHNGLASDSINSVFVDGNTIYVATNAGLSISNDGGITFSNKTIGNGLGSDFVYGVYANGNMVYAATWDGRSGGLSISRDGGATFMNRTTINGLSSNAVYGVYVSAGIIYAATGVTLYNRDGSPADGGLSISYDDGLNWVKKTMANGLGSNEVYGIYTTGNKIFVSTGVLRTRVSYQGGGLSISNDGGATWINKTVDNTGNCSVNPSANNTLALCDTAAGSWTYGIGNNYVYGVHVNGATIYAPTAGGLSISTDNGSTWINKTTSNGLGSNDVYGVDTFDTTVYAITGNGFSFSIDSAATFTNKSSLDGMGSVTVLDIMATGNTVYAATTTGLAISNDNGSTWTTKTMDNTGTCSLNPLTNNTLVLCSAAAGTWTYGLGGNYIYGIYSVGTKIYAATNMGLAISNDSGSTWINITTGLASSAISGGVFVLPGATAGTDRIYAATNAGLSISADSGATWVNINSANGMCSVNPSVNTTSALCIAAAGTWTSGFPGSVYITGVYVIPGATTGTDQIYAATTYGLSISMDSGITWINKNYLNSGTCSVNPGVNITYNLCIAAVGTWTSDFSSFYITGVHVLPGATTGTEQIYAATTNGLSISADGGTTWTIRTLDNTGTCSVSPSTNNTLALCNAAAGTWTYGLGNNYIMGIYVVGTSVYASTNSGGLSISTDGGTSFTNYTTVNGLAGNLVYSAYYSP